MKYCTIIYRGYARAYIKDAEKVRSSAIIDIIHSAECMSVREDVKMPTQGVCERCGYISSQKLCKACVLLEGKPRVSKSRIQDIYIYLYLINLQ